MRNRVERFVSKYRKRGILVDTNLLLLYVVGAYDANHIERFKRTSTFTADDFDLLARLLGNFEAIATTPPILTEVSNFVGQLSQGHRRPCTRLLQRLIPELEEEHRASSSVSAHDYFLQFRLTDAGIADISAEIAPCHPGRSERASGDPGSIRREKRALRVPLCPHRAILLQSSPSELAGSIPARRPERPRGLAGRTNTTLRFDTTVVGSPELGT